MKPDYKNWVPKGMVTALAAGAAAAFVLFVLFGATDRILHGTARIVCAVVLGVGTLALLFFTVWMASLYRTFDYNGKRKLSKTIIDGTAAHVSIPDGGVGLDVGCGSGALTIACAKRNPDAQMVGCDIWSGAYKSSFTKQRCEANAAAEGVSNVRFEEGNAVKLPFTDESFDAVCSNYVYHNISGQDKQSLLLETLRVLKKGGTFAIHDLMSKARYGDMDAFVRSLRDAGYADVRLIDTTDGTFMGHKEAAWLGLGGSTLLVGRKKGNDMKCGMIGGFVKLAFAKTAFDYIEKELPGIDMVSYKKRVLREYRAIVARTPGIGKMKDNMFVMTMYAGVFLIALYKAADGKLNERKLDGLVRSAAYCPLMVKARQEKSAFTEKEIANRTRQAKWSRDHIKEYPMNWFYYFETVPGKDEYYITHKQCGICKLTAQEHCEEITKHLCRMDYYTFEMQGAVLDRTKTLGYGDDECNFHLMSRERAEELGFVKSPDAK